MEGRLIFGDDGDEDSGKRLRSQLAKLAGNIPNGAASLSDFDPRETLGTGAYGRVYRAIHKESGRVVAIKEMFIDQEMPMEQLRDYERELQMMWKCRLPFCLGYLAFTLGPPYSIIVPYAQNGSLYSFTRSNSSKPRLNPTRKTLIAMGVAYGMSGLHDRGVIHRDLKSGNILLNEHYLPLIADWGVARAMPQGDESLTQDCGSAAWMAPEQMSSTRYCEKVDVYAYGCVLYEMLCHQIPWEGRTVAQICAAVAAGERPDLGEKKDGICRLIARCWQQDPALRPSFAQVLACLLRRKYWYAGTNPRGVKHMEGVLESLRSSVG